MTLAFQVARIAVVGAILTTAFLLLPNASEYDTSELTIPDVVWDPLVAVLSLNRLIPIEALLNCFKFTLAIQAGMVAFWLYTWLTSHVLGK